MHEIRPRRYGRVLTPSEAAQIASHERLAQTPDWATLTAKANKSVRHVSRMDRWRAVALQQNPHLEGAKLEQVAETLRADFYRELGRRSWLNRRAA